MSSLLWVVLIALVVLPATPVSAAESKPISLRYVPWKKACHPGEGDDARRVCMTTISGRSDNGEVVISALLLKQAGENQQALRVVLPFGMQTVYGTRVIVDDHQPARAPYVSCYAAGGCFSDYGVDDDFLKALRSGNTLLIQGITAEGRPQTFRIPLAHFDRVFAAAPSAWDSLDDDISRSWQAMSALAHDADQLSSDASLLFSPWTKFCHDSADARPVCATGMEGRRIESGQAVVAAALIAWQREPKEILRITLPLGRQLVAGTRIIIDDEAPLRSPYAICLPNGCMADYEATPELVASLKRGRRLTVQAFGFDGKLLSWSLPLQDAAGGGFDSAVNGPPADPKLFDDREKKLRDDIMKRFRQGRQVAARS